MYLQSFQIHTMWANRVVWDFNIFIKIYIYKVFGCIRLCLKCNVLFYSTRTAKSSMKRQEILLLQLQYEHCNFSYSLFPQVLHLLPLILSVWTLHQSSIKRLASPTHVCSSEKHCVSDRSFMTLLDSDYRTYPPLPPPRPLYEALWDSGTSLNSSTVCFIQNTLGQTPYLSKREWADLTLILFALSRYVILCIHTSRLIGCIVNALYYCWIP